MRAAVRCAGVLVGVAALGLIGCQRRPAPDPAEMAQLIRELDSADTLTAIKAAEKLGAMGPVAEAAVPGLVRLLGSGRGRRQMLNVSATNALLRIGPRAALPALVSAVQGEDEEIAYGAIFTLGGYGAAARAARPVLLKALEKPALQSVADRALRMIDGQTTDNGGAGGMRLNPLLAGRLR